MLDSILYPFILQGLLAFTTLGILAKRRLKAAYAGETDLKYFKTFRGEGEPDHVRAAQRSFHNQFEMPVLFFVVCLAAVVFEKQTIWMIGAAWAYVATRLLHTVIHLTRNKVIWRFRVFILSNVFLFAMWVLLAV